MTSLGLYQPGDTWLHKINAAVKLGAVAVLGVGSWWLNRTWWPPLIVLALIFLAYLSVGFSPKTWWRQIRPTIFILIFTLIVNSFVLGWAQSFGIVSYIAALVSAAALLTLTTKTTALMDVVVRLCSPFRRFGVNPERVGLALALGVRAVPLVAGLARQVREAQDSRGTRSWRAFAVPLLVSALRDADALGEALVARGADDDYADTPR